MDTMIGVDLAKSVYQIHGASMTGDVKFRKKLTRPQFQKFMTEHDPAIVVMEACGGAHYWSRVMVDCGAAGERRVQAVRRSCERRRWIRRDSCTPPAKPPRRHAPMVLRSTMAKELGSTSGTASR